MQIGKVLSVAKREFLATVMTKGFVVGLLLPPVIMTAGFSLIPALLNKAAPAVTGKVAIIDRTGAVADRLRESLRPEKLVEQKSQETDKAVREATERMGIDRSALEGAAKAAGRGNSKVPALRSLSLSVEVLEATADVEEAKKPILESTGREQGAHESGKRLALVHIPEGAVKKTGEKFAEYDIFTAPRLDPEVAGTIRRQASRAIVDARLEAERLDVGAIRALLDAPSANTIAVTKEGERKSNEGAALMIPAAFMFLLWISIITSGQYLLSGTIEEKSNRVMEVLLSAASPVELMLGKILGKGAVGAMIMMLYGGVGIFALFAFAMSHLIAWQTVAYVLIYFVIAYFTIASMMAAIGAAVTEISEAQSLMTPMMMILVIPLMLWMPILRNPNSTFAQVCSFVPLINPFVMVLRICGSENPPWWQIPASMVVGVVVLVFMVWAAAKVFRVGALLYGKPPTLGTLLKWVRMA
jgi:ABC-type Na+ efflux pump permease subunit